MKFLKNIVLFLFLFCCQVPMFGLETIEDGSTGKLPRGVYLSINPLSLSSSIPSVFTKEYLPYLHNLESGVSLASGYYFTRVQLEGRIVFGSPSTLIFCPQLHVGLQYFPFVNDEEKVIPLGFGFFVRGWDTYYTHSKLHFFNLSPHPNVSYVVRVKDFFFDFRVGWDFAVATWSNLEHSAPKGALTHFPPTFSLNIGYTF